MNNLTVWISPFTSQPSLDVAIANVQELARQYECQGNLLLPVAYGSYPQSVCNQTLPADMRVANPYDVAPIRERVEAAGLGFGAWVVPIDPDCAAYHAAYADMAGYLSVNFEGTPDFWAPGDNAGAIDAYWGHFWNSLANPEVLNGNVSVTMVPTTGEQLRWSSAALREMAGGANLLLLEVYGGPNTNYKYPNDWPYPSFDAVNKLGLQVPLAPILALANLGDQFKQAVSLGAGNAHVWAL